MNKPKSSQVNVKLSPDDKTLLVKLITKTGLTVTGVVKTAIRLLAKQEEISLE